MTENRITLSRTHNPYSEFLMAFDPSKIRPGDGYLVRELMQMSGNCRHAVLNFLKRHEIKPLPTLSTHRKYLGADILAALAAEGMTPPLVKDERAKLAAAR